MRQYARKIMLAVPAAFFIVFSGGTGAEGKKPPWAGGSENPGDYPPVSAPEPSVLTLAGIAATVAAGKAVRKRRRRKNMRRGIPSRASGL